ncbi:MAG: CPBP family intramembrane metalloprotease [Pseudonocardiaceae bacterium]|nr:CPBP family intramembrane metalloprotease [Pseudonocardiaceae bacterium]
MGVPSEADPAVLDAAANAPERIGDRVRGGSIGWGAPLLMAFLRLPLIAVGIGLAYVFFALGGYAEPFLLSLTTPTFLMLLVNLISLALLARLTAREGIRLRDLIGFDRALFGRDVGLGLLWLVVLNVPFVVAIMLTTVALTRPADAQAVGEGFEQVFAGRADQALAAVEFPLWWAILTVASFSLLNPVVEEMHYRGYVQPRLAALSGRSWVGVGVTAVGFAAQHITYAYTGAAMLVYFVAFLVWGTGAGLIYRWQRRLPSLIVTHFVVNASFGVLPLVLVLAG